MRNKVKNKEFLVPVPRSLNNLEQKIGLWRLKILTPWRLKWTKVQNYRSMYQITGPETGNYQPIFSDRKLFSSSSVCQNVDVSEI